MDNETSTGEHEVSNAHFSMPMKDVAANIEAKLYGSDDVEEPTDAEFEEVSDDEALETLPDDDDSENDEDEGSDDVVDEVDEDDLSLAAYLGVDEDKLVVDEETGDVGFNAIIDGESTVVPLKDLAASYQLQGHVNNKSIALENERKEFEGTRDKTIAELQSRVDGIAALQKMAEDTLVADYNAIDWDKLRYDDPGTFAALRQEFAEKAQKVENAQSLAREEQQRFQTEQKAKFDENMEKHMKKEYDSMLLKNPDWSDAAVLKTEMDGLRTFVSENYGYSAEDFENVTDHRLIELVKDAKAFREGQKSVVEKKVKRVPKFTKPGAARGNAASLKKARAAKAQKAKLKANGSTQNVADALLSRM